MKLTIWFFILILNLIITLREPAEANRSLFRKKQCKGFEKSCARGSECCSGVCELSVLDSEEDDTPEKLCTCSRVGIPCGKDYDCCEEKAVCLNNQCHIETDCGKACSRGSDCQLSCPHCKNRICVQSEAKCGEPCPSGNNFECLEGLCTNKICKCGSGCKLSNTECSDKRECCKNVCERIGGLDGKKVCA